MNTQNHDISAVLLAGGVGSRMGASLPKQYLKLQGKEVALYSFEVLLAHEQVREVVVVCEKEYESLFKTNQKIVRFASPGKRRQDSVFNGLMQVSLGDYVAVHDSARPLLEINQLDELFQEARLHKAVSLGIRSTSTLKRVDENGFIQGALNRNEIWEVQTPQVVEKKLLLKAFDKAHQENITVTDETSLVSLLDAPVKLIESSSKNIKLTRPADLSLARALLMEEHA